MVGHITITQKDVKSLYCKLLYFLVIQSKHNAENPNIMQLHKCKISHASFLVMVMAGENDVSQQMVVGWC